MMLRNVAQKIRDHRGREVRQPLGEDSGAVRLLTLGDVCEGAMLVSLEGDDRTPWNLRVRNFRLLQRIVAGGEVEMDAEEIVMLKDRIAKVFLDHIAGPAILLLEDKSIEPEKESAE